MFLIRETMHCKPGMVRPMVERFKAMAAIMEKVGMRRPRILTDVSGQPYWTVMLEIEVDTVQAFFEMDEQAMAAAGADAIMAGYHDLVDHGRREIFKIEY
jgi:hypothetical protein